MLLPGNTEPSAAAGVACSKRRSVSPDTPQVHTLQMHVIARMQAACVARICSISNHIEIRLPCRCLCLMYAMFAPRY